MAKDKQPLSDKEIRKLVQREIAKREELRAQEKQILEDRGRTKEEIDRYQKIIEDEKRKYYESHPDFHEYINELGEIEWLTAEEIRDREQLFDDEIEELETGKKRAQLLLIVVFGLFLCAVALVIVLLSEKTGSIQVISNIKGASIYLDSAPMEPVTDAIFTDIPVGKHVVSVEMPGYKIVGDPSQTVELESNEREIVIFMLTEDLGQIQSEEAVKTVFSNGSGQNPPGSSTNP